MGNQTSFTQDNQPKGRGKSFKTVLLDAIRAESLLNTNPESTKPEAEAAFIKHLSDRAFDKDDTASGTLLKELLSKAYGSIKATMPNIEFDFDEGGTPAQQASQVLKASADGVIPPDVAQIFISSIASMMKIDEVTELARRLSEIETLLGVANG
jgi:hypothetical protein